MKNLIILVIATTLAGCSVLPYENTVSCRLEDNYGKCMSIKNAYEGISGDDNHLNLVPGERINPNEEHNDDGSIPEYASTLTSQEMYIDDLYREFSGLIRQEETPMIKAPKQMRTLILSYSGKNNKKTLYMPRYVYTIVEEAKFVVRQYYKTPERDAMIIKPKEIN